MDNENMVKSIKQLCQNNNISISQLETALNFSPSLISRWKDKTPSLDKIVDIADYFHVSLDEVVGYKPNIDDDFLNKLYEKTSDGSILWENGREMNTQGAKIKLYTAYEKDNNPSINNTETIYATRFNKGYIIVYAYHYSGKILYPKNIILFIQPSDDSSLVRQPYNKDDLMKLWVKILNSLGNDAPDEVKAEDLKNSFLNDKEL